MGTKIPEWHYDELGKTVMLFLFLIITIIRVLTKHRGYAMLRITPEQIENYRALYQNKFGKPIDVDQAYTELMALVCFMDAIHRHMEQFDWPDLLNDSPSQINEHSN